MSKTLGESIDDYRLQVLLQQERAVGLKERTIEWGMSVFDLDDEADWDEFDLIDATH